MEKFLLNLDVWCWRYRWNPKNYQGLHFTAKPPACDALTSCLDLLRREGDGARRTIPLRPLKPDDEAKVTGGREFRYSTTLRLHLLAESPLLRQMAFQVEGSVACLKFTERCLADFARGLADVKAGRGDYSIQPRADQPLGELDRTSLPLWFWPCFGHLGPV